MATVMGLLIKNGEIVTGDSQYIADIWCEGETITRIDSDIQAPTATAEVIDATTMKRERKRLSSAERPRSSTCAAHHGRWSRAKGLQRGRHRREEKRPATIRSTWELRALMAIPQLN